MGLYDNMGDMIDILDDFVIETNELIEQLNQDLLSMESNPDAELINRVFRVFHTIKGTSGFLAFDFCMDLAHASEDLLNHVRNGDIQPTSEVIDILFESSDWFKTFIQDVKVRAEKGYNTVELQTRLSDLIKRQSQAQPAHLPKQGTMAPGTPKNIIPTEAFPKELLDSFIQESHDLIETVGNELMSLEIEPDNQNIVDEIFRVFHTLKGNSALVGLTEMSELAHQAEEILGRIRAGEIEVETVLVDGLLEVIDYMRALLSALKAGEIYQHDTSAMLATLHSFLGETNPIVAAGTKDTSASGVTPPSDKDPEIIANTGSKPVDQTIRVDVNRLENLMNVAGELVLEKNKLLLLSQRLKHHHSDGAALEDLDTLNNTLGYISTEIQESVMDMRMLPIDNVFRKFPRMVRDLSKEKNKEIDLIIHGQDTELDRSVIEAIGDPLVHLLRNALDHGIETPEERLSKGKEARGKIYLDAFQESNQIVIRIRDDGQGLDPEKILRQAQNKGIVSADEAPQMTSQEIRNLLFKPGFSTAEEITDLSGRGVGLDVVHTNIARLNGTIQIESVVGSGTSFILKLPLTLTIVKGMVVKVHGETYILPVASIAETLRLDRAKISIVDEKSVLFLRGTAVDLVRLDDLLGVKRLDVPAPTEYIVIIGSDDRYIGLVVSKLMGQEETVVKPLGAALGSVKYLAGATLRGDGKVTLILDPSQILNAHSKLEQALI